MLVVLVVLEVLVDLEVQPLLAYLVSQLVLVGQEVQYTLAYQEVLEVLHILVDQELVEVVGAEVVGVEVEVEVGVEAYKMGHIAIHIQSIYQNFSYGETSLLLCVFYLNEKEFRFSLILYEKYVV